MGCRQDKHLCVATRRCLVRSGRLSRVASVNACQSDHSSRITAHKIHDAPAAMGPWFLEEVCHGTNQWSKFSRLAAGATCRRSAERDRAIGLQQKITESVSSNLGALHRVYPSKGTGR